MRERVVQVENLLERLRTRARPKEWPILSSGYYSEIERMQGVILDCLYRRAAVPGLDQCVTDELQSECHSRTAQP